MKEADLMRLEQLAASKRGDRLFRNNVGTVESKDGRFIRFGLAVGSGDLIGWRRVVVTPDMVGSSVAVFESVEVKSRKGIITPEQMSWHDAVIAAGGFSRIERG